MANSSIVHFSKENRTKRCTPSTRSPVLKHQHFLLVLGDRGRSSRNAMMPNPTVTMIDRLSAISIAAMMASIIFAIGFALHKAITKDSPRKRIQGQPIIWWVTGMMFFGACYGAYIADNQSYYLHEVVGGMGGFGLLGGLAIGNVHGFVNLFRTRKPPAESSDTLAPQKDERQIDNPYAPPKSA